MSRKIFLFISLTILFFGYANSVAIPESINYKVMYKWGLINKQAGHVNLSTSSLNNDEFRATLTAASEPWADKFYQVRDTLNGIINTKTLEPQFYEKISHEGGSYKHDIIRYKRENDKVTANCERTEAKNENVEPTTSTVVHESEGFTLDMLSAFYYMRSLDFASMKPGDTKVMNIFSGKRKETLTITYEGHEQITLDGIKHRTYHITFKFTGKGGKETSDPMDAWLSMSDERVPLLLEGKLPVGKVRCIYIGNNL